MQFRFLIQSQDCVIITTNSRIFHHVKKNFLFISSHSSHPIVLGKHEPNFVSIDLPVLDISYRWSQTTGSLLWLSPSPPPPPPHLFFFFVNFYMRVYLSQIDNISQGARSQMLSRLPFFAVHNVFKFHSYCYMYQHFISFYGLINLSYKIHHILFIHSFVGGHLGCYTFWY